MKSEDFTKALEGYGLRVFTIGDAVRILKKQNKYVSLYLSKIPNIKRLVRGKYYLAEASTYEIASHVVSPSYLSLITAFSIYNLTTQIPLITYVVSTRQHRSVDLRGKGAIKFIKMDKERFFGYEYRNNISIATIEKAIIDSLYLKNNYGEVIEAFDEAITRNKLNIKKLKEFAIMMKSPAIVNKIGFLLSMYEIDCDDLLPYKSKDYVKLSASSESHGKKWRVIYESRWLSTKNYA